MAEKQESFLKILDNYFGQRKKEESTEQSQDTQMQTDRKQKVTVPMEYIFTKKLDRAIIEETFIKLICRANKGYKGKLSRDKDSYGKVSSLEIETTDTGTNLAINARDGWTRVVVTNDANLRGPFYAISEDRLYEEILRVYNMKSVGKVCQDFDLSMEEREEFITKLKDPQRKSQRKDYVISAMTEAAENFVEYYKYMTNMTRKKETALEGAIQQRTGKGVKVKRIGTTQGPRKSEIYDFEQRGKILKEMEPDYTIVIDKIEEDNTVSKFAYTTYVYKNPRDRQGYLFVAEPFEGTHHTRMRFVPQEEYDALQVRKGKNKLVDITERFLEMSDDEFTGSKFSKKFKHTSLESLRARYRRIILGERMPTDAEEMRCKETDKILYDGEIKLTKDNIKKWMQGRRPDQVGSARKELYGRPKEENIISQIPQ